MQDLADHSILISTSSPKETSSYPWSIAWPACCIALKQLLHTYLLARGFLIVALRPSTLVPDLFTGEGWGNVCTFGFHWINRKHGKRCILQENRNILKCKTLSILGSKIKLKKNKYIFCMGRLGQQNYPMWKRRANQIDMSKSVNVLPQHEKMLWNKSTQPLHNITFIRTVTFQKTITLQQLTAEKRG